MSADSRYSALGAAPAASIPPLLRRRLDALAADVGRLRRRLNGDSYDGWLAWRLGEHVDALDAMVSPNAADIYNEHPLAGVDEALATVDARARELRVLLGGDAR
jgi:hypothetical protein